MTTVVELGHPPVDPNAPNPGEVHKNPWLGYDAWIFMKSHGHIPLTPAERAYDHLEASSVPYTLKELGKEVQAPDALDPKKGVAILTTGELYSDAVYQSLRWGWTQQRPDVNAALMRFKEIKVSATRWGIQKVEVTNDGVLRTIQDVVSDPRTRAYKRLEVYARQIGKNVQDPLSYPQLLRFASYIAS